MKMISKIAGVALGLVLVGSSVFAQSLADAKKAIDAEQYQKAKSMLKNLTVTQPTIDENFFYLGWVYLIQEYPDSAKATFQRGIAANPKAGLNYVGLGAVAHVSKDAAGTKSNFDLAIANSSKKDSKPYLYMGKAYLLLPLGVKAVSADDATLAVAALTKGKTNNPKDAEILVELGNVARSQKSATDAYTNYSSALELDPKLLTANVAEGVLWENAQNFEDAEKQFKAALAIDPNFGPAYREWAETDLYWSQTVAHTDGPLASAKVKEAVEHYQKYLSLTDNSTETLLRYADFLYYAGEYKTLQDVANTLSKSAGSNARVYRYIGYASYQNKDYPAGVSAMNNWFAKAEPARIIPNDYFVLGHLLLDGGIDTAKGVAALQKFADLDTTKAEDTYSEIAGMYRKKYKYPEAIAAYELEMKKIHGKPMVGDHFYLGSSYYFEFLAQAKAAKANPAIKPDSSLLTKADSAVSFTQKNATTQIVFYPWYRALINSEKDADFVHLKGLAKPYYDQVIGMLATKTPLNTQEKRFLVASYAYQGYYNIFHEHNEDKALEYFTKAKELDPENAQVKSYFETKAANEAAQAAADAAAAKKAAGKGAAPAAKKPPGH
jgi:tetratricopeptide (TPR) repeat protein